MKVGSCFSGIGGFDLAFEREGFELAWMCEIEPFPRKVLAARCPGVPVYVDINAVAYGRTQNRRRHGLELPHVDLICGGFPCQDLSVAGQRRGLAGGRSGLFFSLMRVVRLVKPEWVVIENVPGLLSSHRGADFAVVINALVECGFGVAWRVLDSQFFGVAQRRRRVFIVACARGQFDRARAVLFEPDGSERDSTAGHEEGAGVAACLRGRSAGAGVNLPGRGGEDDQNLVAIDNRDGKSGTTVPTLRSDCHGANPMIAPTLHACLGHHGWACGDQDFGLLQPVAASLRASDGHQPTAAGVRRLTPLECERLQGFPDGWTCLCPAHGDTQTCTCPDSPRYRALGNAVTVNTVQWIARRLREVMQ